MGEPGTYTPTTINTIATAAATRACMITDISRNEAMASLSFLRRRLSSRRGRRSVCRPRLRRRGSYLRRNLEVKRLHREILVVLFGLHDFHFLEVSRPLQRS